MKLISTNKRSSSVDLKTGILKGMPLDKGLYVPKIIPTVSNKFLKNLSELSFLEISFEVSKLFFDKKTLNNSQIEDLVCKSFNFPTTYKQIDNNITSLELFNGPTASFKDYGARYLSQLMSYFVTDKEQEITILVATSGDTGGAVANSFLNVQGIFVKILFPKDGVSKVQKLQLTTLGNNIQAIEVDGSFDDCQKLVKKAFIDKDLEFRNLSSANSINIARLIAQAIYYFYIYGIVNQNKKKIIFSVPSGNLGNLCGGILSKKMGLPVDYFIAPTNINSIFGDYLSNGKFKPLLSKKTLANAMDCGNPSNFNRVLYFYNNDYNKIKKDIISMHYSDNQIMEGIKFLYYNYNYTCCPHSIIAYLGLRGFIKDQRYHKVFLSTAHPSKFHNLVQRAINQKIIIPDRILNLNKKYEHSISIDNQYQYLKDILL